MRSLTLLIQLFRDDRGQRRNLGSLVAFSGLVAMVVVVYSLLFHAFMVYEGRDHSWLSGLYWTMTTMTTLGFGDITFASDAGRMFSVVVMVSGTFLLLVMLPFTFIEFLYAPWMRAQSIARAPREVPVHWRGHVLLTTRDPVGLALITRLDRHGIRYALLVEDLAEALRLHDAGTSVVLGAADDPDAWRRAGVERAALVAATAEEMANTNVSFTVREISSEVPVVAIARSQNSEEILRLAGAADVLRLGRMLGEALARRTHGGDALAHQVGRFDDLVVAEALVRGTPLVGRTLRDADLRGRIGVTVACVWERGRIRKAEAETRIDANMVLVLIGRQEAIDAYDEAFCIYANSSAPVLVIGGGRVGRAATDALTARGVDWRLIDLDPSRVRDPQRTIVGDGTDPEVLLRAGLREAPAVLLTTRSDDANIYLALCCRRLRPDIQVVARATLERNVSTLHRAGADLVLSYAAMGAERIFNRLRDERLLHISEGLDLVAVAVPPELVGATLADGRLADSGCQVVALRIGGATRCPVDPREPLPANAELILVGDTAAEARFLQKFVPRQAN